MELLDIAIERSPRVASNVRLTGRVRFARGHGAQPLEERFWFEYPGTCEPEVSRSGNPWLACLLPRALRLGEPLVLRLPVDARLLDNARERLAIWHAWDRSRPLVPIEADVLGPAAPERPGRTVSFFSGGVDSWFSALVPRAAPIHDLLLVHGALDLPLEPPAAFERAHRRLSAAADSLGKPLLVGATNVVESSLRRSDLAHISLGSLLGAVALGLEGRFDRILMPASLWMGWLPAWGSHPMTDVLLSTARTAVVCDGVAHSRMDKVVAIARSELALGCLRVCLRTGDETNCNRCEKCLRTAIALDALGVIERCPGLGGRPLSRDVVERLPLHDRTDRYYAWQVEAWAREHGRADLARSIRRARRRSRLRELRRRVRSWLPQLRGA